MRGGNIDVSPNPCYIGFKFGEQLLASTMKLAAKLEFKNTLKHGKKQYVDMFMTI